MVSVSARGLIPNTAQREATPVVKINNYWRVWMRQRFLLRGCRPVTP